VKTSSHRPRLDVARLEELRNHFWYSVAPEVVHFPPNPDQSYLFAQLSQQIPFGGRLRPSPSLQEAVHTGTPTPSPRPIGGVVVVVGELQEADFLQTNELEIVGR
jgi:hypothetical protein